MDSYVSAVCMCGTILRRFRWVIVVRGRHGSSGQLIQALPIMKEVNGELSGPLRQVVTLTLFSNEFK
jgi:hypothetical protein